jgi:hypothetical protein
MSVARFARYLEFIEGDKNKCRNQKAATTGWKRGARGVDREDNSEFMKSFDPKADRKAYGDLKKIFGQPRSVGQAFDVDQQPPLVFRLCVKISKRLSADVKLADASQEGGCHGRSS